MLYKDEKVEMDLMELYNPSRIRCNFVLSKR